MDRIVVSYAEDSREPLCYGVSMFALYGPRPTSWLNEVRTVSCLNDGGRWKFFARVSLYRSSVREYYLRRRIKDRLTLDVLRGYCLALETILGTRVAGRIR